MTMLMNEEVGRFNRTLPPKTRVEYDPRWELGLEVMRWFHYRHATRLYHQEIDGVETLRKLFDSAYEAICKNKIPKKSWPVVSWHIVEPHYNEFCELFKDVLAEIEILRGAR